MENQLGFNNSVILHSHLLGSQTMKQSVNCKVQNICLVSTHFSSCMKCFTEFKHFFLALKILEEMTLGNKAFHQQYNLVQCHL